MEIQEVTDYLILPKKFSLQQIILHSLVKKFWGDIGLSYSNNENRSCVSCITKQLIGHRKTVSATLLQFSKDLPAKLKKELVNAILFLQRGYNEALIWEEKCQPALPFNVLSRITAGDYQASNFIDPSGHFNDLVWAKRFVSDEIQFVQCRFQLACLYCFEERIVELWHTMKNNRQLPFEGRLEDIETEYGDLIAKWAYHVEDELYELIEDEEYFEDGFYLCGLNLAIIKGHEYAAYFFWKHCSDNEKARFLREVDEDSFLVPTSKNHVGVVHFMYSLLSEKQKNNLISWIIRKDKYATIWSCLLHSQYYKTALNDILHFSYAIPIEMYECILFFLSYEMTILRTPVYETIFSDLWYHLPQEKRIELFKIKDSYIIDNLVEIKAMDLLGMIIQPLSHFEKEKMLLNNWQHGGITAICKLYDEGDYDALHLYLLYFIIDCCPITQKFCLRSDASSFIDKFNKSDKFINWAKSIPDSKELNKIIENLQDCLKVLNLLLEVVEKIMQLVNNVLDTIKFQDFCF